MDGGLPLDPGEPHTGGPNGITSDIDVECNQLIEFCNALNVAGDCGIAAVGRLRRAKTSAERTAIKTEFAGFLRRTIGASVIAFAVLGGQPADLIKGER